MRLYIGNGTKQNFIFFYRPEKGGKLMQHTIRYGSQAQIGGEHLNVEQIEYMIKQMPPGGIIAVENVNRAVPFTGLCYSVDKPVPIDALISLLNHNQGILMKRGEQMRKEMAIATNNSMQVNAFDSGLPDQLATFDMSIVQDNHDGHDQVPPLAEGLYLRTDREEGPGKRI